MNKNNDNNYYYRIVLAYEIPYNVLDSNTQDKVQARETLYDTLSNMVPEDKYEKFSVKLVLFQLDDTFNYIVTYEAFFRSTIGLPMEEWVEADEIKKKAKKELEAFFSSMDCDYKQINIKTLL
jgi:hypothetical protein